MLLPAFVPAPRSLALHHPQPYHVGIISTQCKPALQIAEAADDARLLCERKYGDAPPIEILGAKDFTFSYIPSYISHIR